MSFYQTFSKLWPITRLINYQALILINIIYLFYVHILLCMLMSSFLIHTSVCVCTYMYMLIDIKLKYREKFSTLELSWNFYSFNL